jgi:DNA-binding CsgD family transcriptional regulator
MIFWESGRPVAGLSLIWRTAPTPSSFDRGFGVQPYVEFNLGLLLRESARAHGGRPGAIGKLSSREIEVATLASRGHPSARIARDLNIGLATVKTHLLHIFAKTGVNSRTELAALMLRSS